MTMIGVLALQGDFAEHKEMLEQLGADAMEIRRAEELDQIDGLIIPGGESTAIDRLTGGGSAPIFAAIQSKIQAGMPVYGTCMGSIFLAKDIEGSTQGRLAAMDIKVRRNAFGPQRFSFERTLHIPALGETPLVAVFIRAPIIVSCGPQVEVLSQVEEGIVMARQGNLLVSAFHPEITNDTRVHEYFLSMVDRWAKKRHEAFRAGLSAKALAPA